MMIGALTADAAIETTGTTGNTAAEIIEITNMVIVITETTTDGIPTEIIETECMDM